MKKNVLDLEVGDTIIIEGREVQIDLPTIVEEEFVIVDGLFIDSGDDFNSWCEHEDEFVCLPPNRTPSEE